MHANGRRASGGRGRKRSDRSRARGSGSHHDGRTDATGADAILPIERCTVNDTTVVLLDPPNRISFENLVRILRKGQRPHERSAFNTRSSGALRHHGARFSTPPNRHCFDRRWLKSPENRFLPAKLRIQLVRTCRVGEWSGHTPVRFPAVADTMDELRKALTEAAETCVFILTSGGVSMGSITFGASWKRRATCISGE